jgi:hypothetical protein
MLKRWAKYNPCSKAQIKKDQLEALQDEMESAEMSQSLLTHEQSLHKDYIRALAEEEAVWWLKSRSIWLKADDQNTTFFHNQAKVRNWANQISELKTPEGETLQDCDQIKIHTSSHFQALYTASGKDDDHLSDLFLQHIPSKITKGDNHLLDRPIEEEEISRALNHFHEDKAPGPDGFTLHFYKKCWPITKKDFTRMLRFAHKAKKLGGPTNSSFLALLPKEHGASSLNRFRPISLCNISYKILAKIIANRLSPLLSALILPNQGGFVAGR